MKHSCLRFIVPARALLALVAAAGAALAGDDALTPERLAPVRRYIKDGWSTLTRSTRDLVQAAPHPKLPPPRGRPRAGLPPPPPDLVQAAPDPKLPLPAGRPWPVYLSAREDRARVERELQTSLAPEQRAQIELRVLPADPLSVKDHGLLYLPRPRAE